MAADEGGGASGGGTATLAAEAGEAFEQALKVSFVLSCAARAARVARAAAADPPGLKVEPSNADARAGLAEAKDAAAAAEDAAAAEAGAGAAAAAAGAAGGGSGGAGGGSGAFEDLLMDEDFTAAARSLRSMGGAEKVVLGTMRLPLSAEYGCR